jgi:hypothetical protein
MQQAASSLSPLIQRYNVHSRFQAKIIAWASNCGTK